MTKSELLLPVGNYQMCLAAIHGGADAIYVGMPKFNARGRTANQTVEELREIIEICHLYGVKVHVAFNILIFEDEITDAISILKDVIPLGPDALIIQDLGLAKIVKTIYPEQVIHGSTQMTITNHDAITFLNDLQIERFVLARENSLSEIKYIRDHTEKELEVFVHGALCVAYSGQCFTSESIGGRSANRGQCAQSCRFGYELIVDGKAKQLIGKEYLVSPQDLCGINEVSALQEMGIESFKVEGRLKSPAYVGTVAKTYKKALEKHSIDKNDIDKMSITYSRGLFSGWLNGVDHQQLVKGSYQSHRGVYLGKVVASDRSTVSFKTDSEIKKGMGVLIYNPETKKETGSSIYNVQKSGDLFKISLEKTINTSPLKGEEIYLNSSPEIVKEVNSLITDFSKQKKVPVKIDLIANIGCPIMLTVTDDLGNCIKVESDSILEEAKREYSKDIIKKDIEALSRTAFTSIQSSITLSSPLPFIHGKSLKKLRQDAIAKLSAQRTTPKVQVERSFIPTTKENKSAQPNINFLIRSIGQVKDICEKLKTDEHFSVTLDFEFGQDYKDALSLLKSKGIHTGIATTRILKPNEYHHLKVILRLKPDFILARNLGAFQFIKDQKSEIPLHGDFSLNVANSQTANYLLDKGFKSLTTSYDLNAEQLESLLKNTDSSSMEITIHQYMPSFHMEHCVFAAFLSKGSSFKDCGKPCEKHSVELKDQFGNRHFIKADQECRNTMFNATAQSASSLLPNFKALGVTNFRVEFLNEREDVLLDKMSNYIDFVNDKINIETLKENINIHEKYGLGSGQLFKADLYEDRKKDN